MILIFLSVLKQSARIYSWSFPFMSFETCFFTVFENTLITSTSATDHNFSSLSSNDINICNVNPVFTSCWDGLCFFLSFPSSLIALINFYPSVHSQLHSNKCFYLLTFFQIYYSLSNLLFLTCFVNCLFSYLLP